MFLRGCCRGFLCGLVWVSCGFLSFLFVLFLFAGVLSLFLSNKEMLKIYFYRERKMLITSMLALKSKVAIVKQNYF